MRAALPTIDIGLARPPDAVEQLEHRVATDGDDALAHCQLAVLLVDTLGFYEFGDSQVLARAQELLERAVKLDPSHALAHTALGFAVSERGFENAEQALAHFRSSHRLDPKNKTVEVYIARMLVDLEREEEALKLLAAMAPRHGVKLAKLKAELAKAALPVDAEHLLTSGFIRARNFLRSELEDEAERIRNSIDRGRKRRVAKEELDRCRRDQLELERSFDPKRVPASIKALAAAAARYGVGDDVCRPLLMRRIPKKEREKLIRQADKLAGPIDKWLDTFAEGKMTSEAAAFMYLMNGVEEIR